ncbi:hypothetical protein RHGRI_032283 [Rhododendron griersonianum]|uniref:Uncharacterized protein n=1 Tax=Rhododendron griersonianum TaxID=479676 RepID=A0AAV6IEC5_9ERIC|nr:hypothetical protein RHGRI_032283 [Rhododendron griersonianum]
MKHKDLIQKNNERKTGLGRIFLYHLLWCLFEAYLLVSGNITELCTVNTIMYIDKMRSLKSLARLQHLPSGTDDEQVMNSRCLPSCPNKGA